MDSVCYRYLAIISDVLMSVKRTEDSLKKLKQRGRKSQDTPGISGSDMSDDDKIRLQLSLDAEAFVNEVTSPWLLGTLGRKEISMCVVWVGEIDNRLSIATVVLLYR